MLLAHGFARLLEEPNFWMWFIGPGMITRVCMFAVCVADSTSCVSEIYIHIRKKYEYSYIENHITLQDM